MEKSFTKPDNKQSTPSAAWESQRVIDDEQWMRLALEEAGLAAKEGEVPVGAVILWKNQVLASNHNRSIISNDPTAHAEILAIREASEKMKNYRLPEMTLYVTLEPCIMCAGAILQARLARLVYGTSDPKGGAVTSLYSLVQDRRLNHFVEVTGGVLQTSCAEVLSGFFREKRITSTLRNQGG
jgi:tRNA(adenine34) deaminase